MRIQTHFTNYNNTLKNNLVEYTECFSIDLSVTLPLRHLVERI